MNPDPVPPVRPLLTHVIPGELVRREAGITNPQETSNAPPVENDVADSDDSEDVIEDVEMELL